MKTTSERCGSCGAKVAASTGECAYCGSRGAADVPAGRSTRATARLARFDDLAEHPSFDKWMRHRPPAPPRRGGKPKLVARPRAYPAVVVTKRTDTLTQGVGETSESRTSYFVTVEFRNAGRREHEVDGQFWGTVVEDDIGIAYFLADDLVGFVRVDV